MGNLVQARWPIRELIEPAEVVEASEDVAAWGFARPVESDEIAYGTWFRMGKTVVFWFEAPYPQAPLGKLTKFADLHFFSVSGPDQDGVITIIDRKASAKAGRPVEAYDQDASDLERWALKGYARRLLFSVETKAKRVKVPYTEIAPFCVWPRSQGEGDLFSVKMGFAPVRERFFVEELPGVEKRAVKYRVCNCCRDKIGRNINPEIWHSSETDRCTFHQVQICGSVWTCSICSRRINVQRQAHIRAAYDLFITHPSVPRFCDVSTRQELSTGDALMVTLTIRHGIGDDLAGLFSRLKQADREVLQKSYWYKQVHGYTLVRRCEPDDFGAYPVEKASKKGKVSVKHYRKLRFQSSMGYVGRVTTSEINYGGNGWHPHLHQLWFFDRRLSAEEIESFRASLFQEWKAACLAVGLPAPREAWYDRNSGMLRHVGVDVRRALSADEYLTKFGRERDWGPEKEMASCHKVGRSKSKTPFQLLWEYGSQGNKQSGALFARYAEATFGAHQVEFSKGLRKRLLELGLDDILKSDEELAASMETDALKLGELNDEDFEALCGAERIEGMPDAFGLLLNFAKTQGFDFAVKWLRSLPSHPHHRRRDATLDMSDKIAQKGERDFWDFVNRVQDSSLTGSLEDEASLLLYEVSPQVRAKEWRDLARRAQYVWRNS